jgi:hypothetical protein
MPVAGVKLTLQTKTGQTIGKPVFTGSDGFYYFHNVNPNSYTLVYSYMNTRQEQKQATMPLVVANSKSQDVPQIVLKD